MPDPLKSIDPRELEAQSDKATNHGMLLMALSLLAAVPAVAVLLNGSWWGVFMLAVSAALMWASGINVGGAGISREVAKRVRTEGHL